MADPRLDIVDDEAPQAPANLEENAAPAQAVAETAESLEQYLREISRW